MSLNKLVLVARSVCNNMTSKYYNIDSINVNFFYPIRTPNELCGGISGGGGDVLSDESDDEECCCMALLLGERNVDDASR